MRNSNVDRNAVQDMLGDLETRLIAYLEEWRREFGIQQGPEAGIDRKEPGLLASERKDQRPGDSA
jgi:hypothetical protein